MAQSTPDAKIGQHRTARAIKPTRSIGHNIDIPNPFPTFDRSIQIQSYKMKITGVVITSLLATSATAFDKYLRTSSLSHRRLPLKSSS